MDPCGLGTRASEMGIEKTSLELWHIRQNAFQAEHFRLKSGFFFNDRHLMGQHLC